MHPAGIRIFDISSAYAGRSLSAGVSHRDQTDASGTLEPHRAAFGVLGVAVPAETVVAGRSTVPVNRVLARLASEFADAFATTRAAHPNLPPAEARHRAQIDTIRSNRSQFPASAFELHTNLPAGRSISTSIAAVTAPTISVSPAVAPIPFASIDSGLATTSIPHALAAYEEWS